MLGKDRHERVVRKRKAERAGEKGIDVNDFL
jgi:hypothetical protein